MLDKAYPGVFAGIFREMCMLLCLKGFTFYEVLLFMSAHVGSLIFEWHFYLLGTCFAPETVYK